MFKYVNKNPEVVRQLTNGTPEKFQKMTMKPHLFKVD